MGVLKLIGYVLLAIVVLSVVVGGGVFIATVLFVVGACVALIVCVGLLAIAIKKIFEG